MPQEEVQFDVKAMQRRSRFFPTVTMWNQRTRRFKNYPLIKFLDGAIVTYWNNLAQKNALNVFYALYDVYSSSMEWFQTRTRTQGLHSAMYNQVQDAISPVVQDLLICTTRELKARMKINDNHALKVKLDEIVSIGLTGHGTDCDKDAYRGGGLQYLGRNQLIPYCVVFKSCKAHRLDPVTTTLQVLDTYGAAWDGSAGGFVLTKNNRLYVSEHHQIGTTAQGGQAGFYHSAYTSGDPVLCSGEIQLRNGVPTQISNSSGHYRPSPNQLRYVLNLFKKYNVDISACMVFFRSATGTNHSLAPAFLLNPSAKTKVKQSDSS
jgi:hypothetical protein